jgi:hypothetical protein
MRIRFALLVAFLSGCESTYYVKQSDLAAYESVRNREPKTTVPARRKDGTEVLLGGETLREESLQWAHHPEAGPSTELAVRSGSRMRTNALVFAVIGSLSTIAGGITMAQGQLVGGSVLLGGGGLHLGLASVFSIASLYSAERSRRLPETRATVDVPAELRSTQNGAIASGIASALSVTAMAVGVSFFDLGQKNSCCTSGYTQGAITLVTLGAVAVVPSVTAFFVELNRHRQVSAIQSETALAPTAWAASNGGGVGVGGRF